MIILVGGAKSNSGKTTFVRILLSLFQYKFSVIKITPSNKYGEGIITSNKDFDNSPYFANDRNRLYEKGKDTFYFVNDGAKDIFWVRGDKTELNSLLEYVLRVVEGSIIVEGNSFINYKEPDLIFYVQKENEVLKESAIQVKDKAHYIIINYFSSLYLHDGNVFNVNLQEVLLNINHPFRVDLSNVLNKWSPFS